MNRSSYRGDIPPTGLRAIHENTEPDQAIRLLSQIDLALRWKLSIRTLERWRWLKRGPKYMKVGGRVRYRLSDVEAFEKAHERLGERPTEDG